MKILSPYEMRLLEKASVFFGINKDMLMENAGSAVARQLAKDFRLSGKKIVVACGNGNNGGDGLVALRHLLRKGLDAKAILVLGEPKAAEAKNAYKKLKEKFPDSCNGKLNDLPDADIIIDTIFGTGFRGKLDADALKAVKEINRSNAIKVSVDVPSGLIKGNSNGIYVNADMTYCLHSIKKGSFLGKLRVLDIGMPKEAEKILLFKDISPLLKERDSSSHKGQNGSIAIIAGSDEYPGSAMLSTFAAKAAFRSGIDLARVAAPEKVAWLINLKSPDIITIKLKGDCLKAEHEKDIQQLIDKSDSILIGPGLGNKGETALLVRKIVERNKNKKVVVDADGIKAVKRMKFNNNVLLTPHSKEFEIFSGKKLPENYRKKAVIVKETATRHKCVILLKGPLDIISDGKRVAFNATGNASMTVGGTGDVLAGLCTSFASKTDIFDAACLGAFINGYCADKLFKEKAYGLIASDIIDEVPKAIAEIMKGAL